MIWPLLEYITLPIYFRTMWNNRHTCCLRNAGLLRRCLTSTNDSSEISKLLDKTFSHWVLYAQSRDAKTTSYFQNLSPENFVCWSFEITKFLLQAMLKIIFLFEKKMLKRRFLSAGRYLHGRRCKYWALSTSCVTLVQNLLPMYESTTYNHVG